jgi:hypothetical protein
MSACAMLTYSNVSANAWNCGKEVAASYGVTINSNSGCGSASGFTVCWNYNPNTLVAQIQCTDSPWWAPCSVINNKINDAVEQCLSQQNLELTALLGA